MDTLFATNKSGKSSRGNTCCQLLVTYKGFIYVVSMKYKSKVMQAVKKFVKKIGAPEEIICDMSGGKTLNTLQKFFNEIGTTFRFLGEGTPWAKKVEIYIGLIKEAFQKDSKDYKFLLDLWDYYVERRSHINILTDKDITKLHGTNDHNSLLGDEGDI